MIASTPPPSVNEEPVLPQRVSEAPKAVDQTFTEFSSDLLTQKYRPRCSADLVGNETAIDELCSVLFGNVSLYCVSRHQTRTAVILDEVDAPRSRSVREAPTAPVR